MCNGFAEAVQVLLDVRDGLHMPSIRLVPLIDVLGEAEISLAVDGDEVVIIKNNELAQAKMARERAGLGRDTLLEAAITADDVGVGIENFVIRSVVGGGHVALGDRHTDCVADSLAEGASADFNT